ncbi:MAG TPA: 7-cyano-7-deazaguanine synthase QueC [Methylocystis sp.]|nr:7-cyano-7-deazaguanine synthase QueC [Methylocystis sp.]
MTLQPTNAALVLFSGGQDSTACLAHALSRCARVETIGFDYGQRHIVELAQRGRIRSALQALSPLWRERLGEDHLIAVPALGQISQTALTRDAEIAFDASGLPNTFVPGRNILFLTFAAALAYRRGIGVLVGGMCETDYSGYPDCRRATIDATQTALSLGLDREIAIETPLMRLDKAATWRLTEDLGGEALNRLIVEETHSCYLGSRDKRFDWGYGCGECPACRLRAAGYEKYLLEKRGL